MSNDKGAVSEPAGQRAVPPITLQGFTSTAAARKTLAGALADRRLRRVAAVQHTGGMAEAITQFTSAPTPNLLVIETTGSPTDLVTALDALAAVCDPTTRVLLMGRRNDVGLYRSLIRAGVSDYLVLPLKAADLVGAIAGLFVDPAAPRVGRLIVTMGARGGAGSSTVAQTLATILARDLPHDVLLVDADFSFGTAALSLDQQPAHGLADLFAAPTRADLTLVERSLHRVGRNLCLLAAPARLDRGGEPNAEDMMALADLAQQLAPVVILDLPRVWTGFTREALRAADDVILTATPDLPSLRNLRELGAALVTLRGADMRGHLVLNKRGAPGRTDVSSKDVEAAFGAPVALSLPFDARLFNAMEANGQPLVSLAPKHRMLRDWRSFTQTLIGQGDRARAAGPRLPRLKKAG
jgi:pilus assembly protein CpaE